MLEQTYTITVGAGGAGNVRQSWCVAQTGSSIFQSLEQEHVFKLHQVVVEGRKRGSGRRWWLVLEVAHPDTLQLEPVMLEISFDPPQGNSGGVRDTQSWWFKFRWWWRCNSCWRW